MKGASVEEAIDRLKKVGASSRPVEADVSDANRLVECQMSGFFAFGEEGFTVRGSQGMVKFDPDGIDFCEVNETLLELPEEFAVLDLKTGVAFATIGLCNNGIRIELTRATNT